MKMYSLSVIVHKVNMYYTIQYKILEGENLGELQEINQIFVVQNFLS